MSFDASSLEPIGAAILGRVQTDVADLAQHVLGAASGALPAGSPVLAQHDAIAAHGRTEPPLLDELRSATQFAVAGELIGTERLASAIVAALAQLPEATRTALSNQNVAVTFTKLSTVPGLLADAARSQNANPAVVASLSLFFTAAFAAVSPAEVAFAGAILASLVSEVGPETVASTITVLLNNAPPATSLSNGIPLGMIVDAPMGPRDDGNHRRVTAGRRAGPSRVEPDDSAPDAIEELLPDVDERGHPYGADERALLARWIRDPRRGAASEAQHALAAWRTFRLDLFRDPGGIYDFVDAQGEGWNLVVDDDAERCARAVRALGTNAIVRSCGDLSLHRPVRA